MPITHTDGQTYYSQAEVEATVKDRVKNVGEKVSTAEASAAEWKRKYDEVAPKVATADTLAAQLEEWKAKAEQAQGGLTRYQAAAGVGVTDADTIEALEAAHSKAMKGVAKDKQVDFPTYLGSAKKDPSLLPSYLRGVFGQGGQGGAGQGQGQDKGGTGAQDKGGAGQDRGQGGQDKGGGQTQRPAWAPAVTGQQQVQTGATPSFAERVQGAKTLDDLVKLQAERCAGR